MSVFSKTKLLLVKAAWQAISKRVSYDVGNRALRLHHDLVALAARRAMKKAEEIEDAGIEAKDGRYLVKLKTANGVKADIPMIPKQLVLGKDRVKVVIELPEGIRVAHEKAVLSYMVRFTDKVFHFSGSRLGGMQDIDYDGKKNLTYTRRIEDFPLARVYSKYVKEGTVLPIEIAPDHLVLDLSQMFPKGVRIDLKKILSVKNLFPAGKKGERN
ncbi:MAG: hypothetical protein K9L59_09050 [Desulfobacterales bacterium]|nr:hypothetical protein [Desulfobacterales bacterium]MCF8079869.1 hypothetical protein [Desulfobacterales bacterium]